MEQSYKEKYERALAKLRGLIDGIREEKCEIVEDDIIDIFPELKESEDERIVKELLTFFREGIHGGHILTNKEYDSWIAWLEKQGEKDILEDAILDGNKDGLIAETIRYKNEKQSEKKPAWNKEDKGIIEEVVSYLINYSNIVESKEDADRIEYLIDKIQDICPHQKQEWTEEDEAGLGDALWAIKQARTVAKDENDMGNLWYAEKWLKSLKGRVQLKQEWSEEDEEHIDSLLKRLDALCRNKFERTRFAISEDEDWLKSLRPQNTYNPYKAVVESIAEMCKHYDKASHSGLRDFYDNVKVKCKEAKEYDKMFPQNHWKPSDEQMEALDWQVENTSVSSWQYKATKELMEDLKKLKEE